MDNCDLEKLSLSGVQLCPSFKPHLTLYTATVPSHISEVTLDVLTSDCGASHLILFGNGSKCLKLEEGLNQIDIEVTAEDGTVKKYHLELTKLSSTAAKLTELTLQTCQLHPDFSSQVYEYSSTVSFDCCTLTLQPQVPDPNMKVVVNEGCSSDPVFLNAGDTVVTVTVLSPDGANSQRYCITVTREQIPLAVTFCHVKDQMEFECPVSLNALYRPLSINPSDPKVVVSAPYIDLLTRRSKVHPFSGDPLEDTWKLPETELDKRISNTSIRCFFAHRGCETVLKFAEIAAHARYCLYKPPPDLDTKEVSETKWYKQYFSSAHNLKIETKHSVQVRSWEKRLQTATDKDSIDDLCNYAQSQIKLYKKIIPKAGDMMQNEAGQSPLHCLEQAAVHYATAIKFKPHNPKLHFLLGQTLEECYYAKEMYDLKKKTERDDVDLGEAQVSGMQEEIWAICKLHGFRGKPTMENQLKALDMEYHQLKEQGQSEKSDYIQTLFIWLTKKARMDSNAGVSHEESSLHRALQKYLDAWSLSPDDWELNLHVGRLLLLQEKSEEALQHLQTALALKPSHAPLRFYTGLALLQQDGASVEMEKEAILFLHHGLEYVMSQSFYSHDQDCREQKPDAGCSLSIVNVQFLRGCLSLGGLLSKHTTLGQTMSPMLVYQNVAVMAAQALSVCVGQGQVTQQLERVLLDAHFASLQVLIEQENIIKQAWTAKRCRALSALIRLSCITSCRELLDMQIKVCELGVTNTPCSSTALCVLGLAQLAHCDSDADSEMGQAALANACLSFQASILLEGLPLTGDPPEQLTKQKWWQDHLAREKEKTKKQSRVKEVKARGSFEHRRIGKGAPGQEGTTAMAKTSASTRGFKTVPGVARGVAAVNRNEKSVSKPNLKTQISHSKSEQECSTQHTTKPAAPLQEGHEISGVATPAALNPRSHVPRLGLARGLVRSPKSHQQACSLYQEVITMSPQVHDAYIELANLLVESDPEAAVDVYSRFPLKPVNEQTFDDAFITGEIVHTLMKQEMYEHPQLAPNLIAYGKVMGLSCIEKYVDILDKKFRTKLLKTVYAGIHNKSVEDEDLQAFFKFKSWI